MFVDQGPGQIGPFGPDLGRLEVYSVKFLLIILDGQTGRDRRGRVGDRDPPFVELESLTVSAQQNRAGHSGELGVPLIPGFEFLLRHREPPLSLLGPGSNNQDQLSQDITDQT